VTKVAEKKPAGYYKAIWVRGQWYIAWTSVKQRLLAHERS
jgi:hypothetical protein